MSFLLIYLFMNHFNAIRILQDNCGSFDKLIPLLPSDISFLAIDLPGHGHSSRYPRGTFYHNNIDGPILIRSLQKHFGWQKVSLMCHSLGAMMSFIFASSYPDDVDFMVSFDFIKPLYRDDIMHERHNLIDDMIKFEAQVDTEPPAYTMDELKHLWCNGQIGKSVEVEHVSHILARNTRPSKANPEKFCITRDPRLKVQTLYNFPHEEMLECAKRITVPFFATKGKQAPFWEEKSKFFEVLETIRASSSDCRFYVVDGTHHHHLNNPEVISGYLSDFLNKYYKRDVKEAAKL